MTEFVPETCQGPQYYRGLVGVSLGHAEDLPLGDLNASQKNLGTLTGFWYKQGWPVDYVSL